MLVTIIHSPVQTSLTQVNGGNIRQILVLATLIIIGTVFFWHYGAQCHFFMVKLS